MLNQPIQPRDPHSSKAEPLEGVKNTFLWTHPKGKQYEVTLRSKKQRKIRMDLRTSEWEKVASNIESMMGKKNLFGEESLKFKHAHVSKKMIRVTYDSSLEEEGAVRLRNFLHEDPRNTAQEYRTLKEIFLGRKFPSMGASPVRMARSSSLTRKASSSEKGKEPALARISSFDETSSVSTDDRLEDQLKAFEKSPRRSEEEGSVDWSSAISDAKSVVEPRDTLEKPIERRNKLHEAELREIELNEELYWAKELAEGLRYELDLEKKDNEKKWQKIMDLSGRIGKLKAREFVDTLEIEHLQKEKKELERELNRYEEEVLPALAKERDAFVRQKEEIERLKAELEQARKPMEEAVPFSEGEPIADVRGYEQAIDDLQNQLAEAHLENEQLSQAFQEENKRLQEREMNEDLLHRLEGELTGKIETLTENVKQLEKTNRDLKTEKEELTKHIEEELGEDTVLRARIVELEENEEKTGQKIALATKEMQNLQSQVDGLENEKAKMAETLAQANRQAENAKKKISELKEERIALQEDLEKAQSVMLKHLEEMKPGLIEEGKREAKEELVELRSQVKDLEQDLANREQRLKEFETFIAAVVERSYQEGAATAAGETRGLQKRIDDLQGELQEAAERLKNERERYREELDRIEPQVQKKIEEIEKTRLEEIERLQKELRQKEEELEAALQSDEKDEEIALLQARLDELTDEYDAVSSVTSSLSSSSSLASITLEEIFSDSVRIRFKQDMSDQEMLFALDELFYEYYIDVDDPMEFLPQPEDRSRVARFIEHAKENQGLRETDYGMTMAEFAEKLYERPDRKELKEALEREIKGLKEFYLPIIQTNIDDRDELVDAVKTVLDKKFHMDELDLFFEASSYKTGGSYDVESRPVKTKGLSPKNQSFVKKLGIYKKRAK